MSLLLSACGSGNNSSKSGENTVPDNTNVEQSASEESKIKSYTDSKNHTVEIPVNPQGIVYTGSNVGDILALGVKPLGAALGVIADQVAYPELLEGIEDVGDVLADLEKVLSLNPDLILLDAGGTYYEEGTFDALSKIGPTVTYDRLPTKERLRILGEILGKEQEADTWITNYEVKALDIRTALDVQDTGTASVFLSLGKDLYVMGNSGLSLTIYETLGFVPSARVKSDLIDKT